MEISGELWKFVLSSAILVFIRDECYRVTNANIGQILQNHVPARIVNVILEVGKFMSLSIGVLVFGCAFHKKNGIVILSMVIVWITEYFIIAHSQVKF